MKLKNKNNLRKYIIMKSKFWKTKILFENWQKIQLFFNVFKKIEQLKSISID